MTQLPPWSVPALFATGLFAAHYLALRAASGKVGDGLGALCLEGAAAAGILILIAVRAVPAGAATPAGIAWSCVSGLCISGATVLLFAALRLGGPVSAVGTIVLGGGVALAALLAPLFFSEVFSLRRTVGVALGVAAMAVLATERG
jgi:bacterial/archaeal transporter family protein